MKSRLSLEGKQTALAFVIVLQAVAVSFLTLAFMPWWIALPITLLISVAVALTLARAFMQPVTAIVQALINSIQNFSDRDFSITITETRNDELGELVRSHNQVGEILRNERHNLYQRELLLETVFESVPVTLLLTDEVGRILLSNVSARHLLGDGRRLEGRSLSDLTDDLPAPIAEAIDNETTGLVTIEKDDGDVSTYYLQSQRFRFNNREQRLLQVRDMTRELRREEVAVWKKVIRVISHELNNSLAPITSLAHSGQLALEKDEREMLDQILTTIAERAGHLKTFIEGYARFARLPLPVRQETNLKEWLERLALQLNFTFSLNAAQPFSLDPTQFEQVIINLVRNARDIKADVSVEVAVNDHPSGLEVVVRDHGPGMSSEVLRHALLPFYSTRQQGTGLGLALCREIVEGHEGTIQLANHPEGGLEVRMIVPGASTLPTPHQV